jgi:aminoglycoside 6'-N-acetyltransferase
VSHAPRASFRALAAGDLVRLTRWLNEPHVTRFWTGPRDSEAVRAHYEPRIAGVEPVLCRLVSWDGEPCGMFQHYRWASFPAEAARIGARPGEAGIDYLIGEPALTGRGLGPVMLGAFLEREVLADPGVTGVRVDVAAENHRSRRVLEKLGFSYRAELDFPDAATISVVYHRPR